MATRRVVDEVEVLAVEVDEVLVEDAIEEVESEYGCEDLNRLEGIGERVTVGPEGEVLVDWDGEPIVVTMDTHPDDYESW